MTRISLLFSAISLAFAHLSYAQGPMPPCISAASNAAIRMGGGKLENITNIVAMRSSNAIEWQLVYRNVSTSQVMTFLVIAETPDCRILSIRGFAAQTPASANGNGENHPCGILINGHSCQ
jgi:hypothetical protein